MHFQTHFFLGYLFPIHTFILCEWNTHHGDEGHKRRIPPEHPVLNVQHVEKTSATLSSSQGQEAELLSFLSN